jgi:hypothetical protein
VLCNNWYTQSVEMLLHNSKIAGEAVQGSDHSNSIISGTELAPTMWESPKHSSVTAESHTQGRVKDKLIGVVKNQRLELLGTKIAPQVWYIPTRSSVTAGSHIQERVKNKLIETVRNQLLSGMSSQDSWRSGATPATHKVSLESMVIPQISTDQAAGAWNVTDRQTDSPEITKRWHSHKGARLDRGNDWRH